jgi:GST-like protein
MIDFYGMISPNVYKVAIMLEEVGLAYRKYPVGVMNGENHKPAFLTLNPIAKVPVIVDHDGARPQQPIFESGAILIYLAETYKPELFPASGNERWVILQWLMVQMSLVGPMLGQVNHFQLIPSESDSYAAHRFRDQAARALRNIDDRLKISRFIGGDKYSIADIAVYPWMGYIIRHGLDEKDYPNLIDWRNKLDKRPAIKRGAAAMDKMAPKLESMPTEQDLDTFFVRRAPGPKADILAYLKRGPMFTAQGDKEAKD